MSDDIKKRDFFFFAPEAKMEGIGASLLRRKCCSLKWCITSHEYAADAMKSMSAPSAQSQKMRVNNHRQKPMLFIKHTSRSCAAAS